MLDVLLGGLGGVVCGVMMMALSRVGMMSSGLVIAGFMLTRGFAVMAGCVFVVFGCFSMVLGRLLGHVSSLNLWWAGRGKTAPGGITGASARHERAATRW
jgi:hypothetical protein